MDFPASYQAVEEAVHYCRSGQGPALLHAHTTRPYAHSLSDDETSYKTPEEREQEAARDPIRKLAGLLEREGIADEHAILTIHDEVDQEIHEALEEALKASPPAPGSALKFLYSPTVDPQAPSFSRKRGSTATRERWWTPLTPVCGTRCDTTRASSCSART